MIPFNVLTIGGRVALMNAKPCSTSVCGMPRDEQADRLDQRQPLPFGVDGERGELQ